MKAKRYLFSMKIPDLDMVVFSICTNKQAFTFLNRKLKKEHGLTVDRESENYIIERGEEK